MWSITDLCFMCSNDNKCNIVDDNIATQVEYLMPEIRIIKLELPLRICSICEENLQLFSTFKQNCVENSLRLEARINEAQYSTELKEKCATSERNNKNNDVCTREEDKDESDNLLLDEISIKEEPNQENPYDREFGDVLQDILKKESPPQTDIHLHEGTSVDMDGKSDQNSDDPEDIFSDNEINVNKNILISGSGDRKIYTCLICKKDFQKLSYLKVRHMKIHFEKKGFQCDECKKWFKSKSSLAIHIKQHAGVKDFQCNECKKWFSRKCTLEIHMKQHTGVKDFQCNECKKWFLYKSSLFTHKKQHIGIKDFQCNECKKWFMHKSHLITHIKQHTGVKDFQCNECKKWFIRKSHLDSHMKLHTGVKDFQCSECKKWFLHKTQLSRHMKQHTGVKDKEDKTLLRTIIKMQ